MAKFYPFDAIIASRGSYVHKETTWLNVKVGDEVKVEIESNPKSIAIDPYSCATQDPNTIISLDGKPWTMFLVKSYDTLFFIK